MQIVTVVRYREAKLMTIVPLTLGHISPIVKARLIVFGRRGHRELRGSENIDELNVLLPGEVAREATDERMAIDGWAQDLNRFPQ